MKKIIILSLMLSNFVSLTGMGGQVFELYKREAISGASGEADWLMHYWLTIAARRGDLDKVQEYLSKINKADINTKSQPLFRTGPNPLPLFAAVILATLKRPSNLTGRLQQLESTLRNLQELVS